MGATQISGSQINKRWAIGLVAFVLAATGAGAVFQVKNAAERPVMTEYGDGSRSQSGSLTIASGGTVFRVDAPLGRVGVGTFNPKATLDVLGTVSGSSINATSTFLGAGLVDCDLTAQKLAWDASTSRFSCGTDQAGGGGPDSYVNTAGDTMTGVLLISGDSSTLGELLRTEDALTSAFVELNSQGGGGPILVQGSNGTDASFKIFDSDGSNIVYFENGNGSVSFLGGSLLSLFNSSFNEVFAIDANGGMVVNTMQDTNADFRVASLNQGFMFHVDSSVDRVGIITATPKATLDVRGTMSGSRITLNGGVGSGKLLLRGSDGGKVCMTDTDGVGQTVFSCNNGTCSGRIATGTECNQ